MRISDWSSDVCSSDLSLDDMLAWARNWLDPTPQQLRWLGAEQRRAMWTARTPMPIPQRRRDWDNTHYYAYAFGFRLADVDGQWTVSPTGPLGGMDSLGRAPRRECVCQYG